MAFLEGQLTESLHAVVKVTWCVHVIIYHRILPGFDLEMFCFLEFLLLYLMRSRG